MKDNTQFLKLLLHKWYYWKWYLNCKIVAVGLFFGRFICLKWLRWSVSHFES